MPSLKDLKNRIASVKSTRKITSAMKMVAASKLRRAQERAESARPYSKRMAAMLETLVANTVINENTSRLLVGTGDDTNVLLIVMTSDRGLCGAFNGSVVRETRKQIRQLESEGKIVKLFCIGRKGRDLLRRDHSDKIVSTIENIIKRLDSFSAADEVTKTLLDMFEAGEFDVVHVVYNRFKSAISQLITVKQIIPIEIAKKETTAPAGPNVEAEALFELFEPKSESILSQLLPRNLAVQVYGTLLESAAGEQGARMTSMDNATRNAGEMIDRLTLNYNRSRQAAITKELIEIISGAEAAA